MRLKSTNQHPNIMKSIAHFATAALALGTAQLAQAQSIFGLGTFADSPALYQFTTTGIPIGSPLAITGLHDGDTLVDIDFFSSGDGLLYGLAQSGTLYTLDTLTGFATINVSMANMGTPVAIDFNPLADRLRVESGVFNYRLTPGTGTVSSDGRFEYCDGTTPNLVAAAYTNNFNNPSSTTLYSIDKYLDALVIHSGGPEFSDLTVVAPLKIGNTPFNAGDNIGFDIVGANTAYLSSGQLLFTLNLTNGQLTPKGVATHALLLTDIAVAVPEPAAFGLAGLVLAGVAIIRRRSVRQKNT
jgi:hypothetical protein